MLRLAVATDAETLARIREPLADRGIEAVHVPTRERVQPLSAALAGDDDSGDGPAGRDVDVGFVYPPRVMEGGVADALLDVPWVNDREAILRSRNKAETLARLGRAGLPIPDSVHVSNPVGEADLQGVFERFEPPVVVKPNSATRGVGVARADDLDSFLGLCDYLDLVHDYRAVDDRSFVVQEFLPNARDFRAMVIDGEYVGAVERRLPAAERAAGRWKHNVHRGAVAEGVDLPAAYRRLAEEAAETLEIDWLGVDLLVVGGADRDQADAGDEERDDDSRDLDPDGDHVLLNETNARPTVDTATKYEPDFYDRLAELIHRTAEGRGR